MSAQLPDPDTLRAVLTLATQAPSVHNSQPWHWRVEADGLHLYADPSRHLPNTDPDRRDLLVSCGAALHHCVSALAALGWGTKVRRFPNPADRDHLASIEVHRQQAGELDITLAAAIARRRTDRRNYSSWPVPGGDIALMGARAARAGVMLRQLDLLPHLSAIIAQSVAIFDPHAPVPARAFAGPALAQPAQTPPAEDNAVLIALGTETDDDLARLRAGEATSLVLLSATAMGLATCPVTEPLEIAETREAVRADVFGTSGYPQIMLRMGWAAVNADPLPVTPRRPLSEVTFFAS
ncbi:Acg family FMN-binding oxidoreductase [Mycolicibacterium sp. Dal123E01]|uniref:Acg family FMN-binding oxidoreductase n=1 Tax=Mycolicibacterium sp. Dal123E01 TaxID=3457578 RepID=UPI00403E4D14